MPAFLLLLFESVGLWLLKNIGPQILISLGVGVFSLIGFSALTSNLSSAIDAMSTTSSSLNALFHMFGIYLGIKILLTAVSIKASLSLSNRLFFYNAK